MRTNRFAKGFVCLLLIYMLFTVLLPIASMFLQVGQIDALQILTSRSFAKALRQSLYVSLTATAISVSLAGILAWVIARTKVPFAKGWSLIFTLPMLIPSISHGMGLVVLLGQNGLLTNLLGIQISIYGFWGIVVGSVMYTFPVAFIMLNDTLRYEDSQPYEAATVLGLKKRHQFTAIALPYLSKPLASVVFCVFTMVITDYGVPLTVGGKYTTLPVVMYQDVIGLLDFAKGSLIGIVLLFPAILSFIADMLNRKKPNQRHTPKPFHIATKPTRDRLCLVLCCLAASLILLPLLSFLLLSFIQKYPSDMSFTLAHIEKTFAMNAGKYLIHSIGIALLSSGLGLLLATSSAYFTARRPSLPAKVLHLIALTTLAIPGIVLGLSYSLFFSGTFLYGTLAIMVVANTIHFFASPYLMIYNTFSTLNRNYEALGLTLGVKRFAIFKDVLLPQSKGTLIEMFSYIFINCMMTISAVSFLATVSTKPLSLLISQFESQMMLESAAFVSLLILCVNLIAKALSAWFQPHLSKGVAKQ